VWELVHLDQWRVSYFCSFECLQEWAFAQRDKQPKLSKSKPVAPSMSDLESAPPVPEVPLPSALKDREREIRIRVEARRPHRWQDVQWLLAEVAQLRQSLAESQDAESQELVTAQQERDRCRLEMTALQEGCPSCGWVGYDHADDCVRFVTVEKLTAAEQERDELRAQANALALRKMTP